MLFYPTDKLILKIRIKSAFEKLGFIRKIQLQRDELKVQRKISKTREKELDKSYKQYQALINTSLSGIAVSNTRGEFVFTNKIFPDLFGYSESEILGMTHFQLVCKDCVTEVQKKYKELIAGKVDFLEKVREYLRKDSSKFWGHISVSVIKDEKGFPESIVSFLTNIDKLKSNEQQLIHAKNNSESSLTYAKRIQNALLPDVSDIVKHIKDFFVFFRPKEVVSGDFFWWKKINNFYLIAAADCTGHGVSGAFMSLLFISMLNEYSANRKIINAANILEILRANLQILLNKEGNSEIIQDGMDIALCVYDIHKQNLQYAGAFNPLIYFRDGKMIEIKGDAMPVGLWRNKKKYKNHDIDVKEGDIFYIFSDGFYDQPGGQSNRKFMKGNFRKLLKKIHFSPHQKLFHITRPNRNFILVQQAANGSRSSVKLYGSSAIHGLVEDIRETPALATDDWDLIQRIFLGLRPN